jgi:hypothetical protein
MDESRGFSPHFGKEINIWIESDFFSILLPTGSTGLCAYFLMAPALLTCGQSLSMIDESSIENILLTLENETFFRQNYSR